MRGLLPDRDGGLSLFSAENGDSSMYSSVDPVQTTKVVILDSELGGCNECDIHQYIKPSRGLVVNLNYLSAHL